MKIKDSSKEKTSSGFKITKRLNKYDDVVLFPNKLKMANENIRKRGLPAEVEKDREESSEFS